MCVKFMNVNKKCNVLINTFALLINNSVNLLILNKITHFYICFPCAILWDPECPANFTAMAGTPEAAAPFPALPGATGQQMAPAAVAKE